MKTKLRLPVDSIVKGYVEEGKSTPALAKEYGVSTTLIIRRLKDNGVQLRNRKDAGKLVQGGSRNGMWRGGRSKIHGYIQVWLPPGDFFYSMTTKNGYVREHRLVVAKALGRCLQPWEIVHHKHAKYPAGSVEDKQDNRYPENLQLVTDDRHKQITILENRIKLLEGRVLKLEAENVLLSSELRKAAR